MRYCAHVSASAIICMEMWMHMHMRFTTCMMKWILVSWIILNATTNWRWRLFYWRWKGVWRLMYKGGHYLRVAFNRRNTVPWRVVSFTSGQGLLIIFIGLTVRFIASFLSTFGNKFRWRTMIFIAVSWIPKATVQVSQVKCLCTPSVLKSCILVNMIWLAILYYVVETWYREVSLFHFPVLLQVLTYIAWSNQFKRAPFLYNIK